jgi:hypothetical protein
MKMIWSHDPRPLAVREVLSLATYEPPLEEQNKDLQDTNQNEQGRKGGHLDRYYQTGPSRQLPFSSSLRQGGGVFQAPAARPRGHRRAQASTRMHRKARRVEGSALCEFCHCFSVGSVLTFRSGMFLEKGGSTYAPTQVVEYPRSSCSDLPPQSRCPDARCSRVLLRPTHYLYSQLCQYKPYL